MNIFENSEKLYNLSSKMVSFSACVIAVDGLANLSVPKDTDQTEGARQSLSFLHCFSF